MECSLLKKYGWQFVDLCIHIEEMMDEWITCDFKSFSTTVIPERWADDNERLCAVETRLWLRRFCLERGSNSGPLDQKRYNHA